MPFCSGVQIPRHVIFSIYYDTNQVSSVNYAISQGKMYVYQQNMNKGTICFDNVVQLLKFKLYIEKIIYQKAIALSIKKGNILAEF